MSKVNPEYKYAIFMETSGEDCESWYTFIRYQGNEKAIDHLEKQIESVDWYTLDDLSTFTVEKNFLVSEQTAKEMTKIDLNSVSFHRKFDGKLEMIDLGLEKIKDTEDQMIKVFDILGYGQIEDYLDDEDIDPEDLASTEEDEESDFSESEEESEEEVKPRQRLPGKLPGSIERPRAARAKRRNPNK